MEGGGGGGGGGNRLEICIGVGVAGSIPNRNCRIYSFIYFYLKFVQGWESRV